MPTSYQVKLNNAFQAMQGSPTYRISYQEGFEADQWTVKCKIDGEVKGEAVAKNKRTAREEAARQACVALEL
ncbi:hypothetical protein BDW22DRAFT_1423959 [Trametopsis cervina]|nr:hypothetical protein BDW22DRAFT_1423959 [Trametopsis cervina]